MCGDLVGKWRIIEIAVVRQVEYYYWRRSSVLDDVAQKVGGKGRDVKRMAGGFGVVKLKWDVVDDRRGRFVVWWVEVL